MILISLYYDMLAVAYNNHSIIHAAIEVVYVSGPLHNVVLLIFQYTCTSGIIVFRH